MSVSVRSHCDYLEEFPVQALPHFAALSGRRVPEHGFLVVIMQYGLNHTDTLGPGRAESEWTKAWRSNFLHPVIYYYSMLPTGQSKIKGKNGKSKNRLGKAKAPEY